MRNFFFISLFLITKSLPGNTQPLVYTVSNAHSHNDYVHPNLFFAAYRAGFGSIEADIFLFHGKLLIGHDTADLAANRTLETYYLKPLDSCIRKNRGRAYPKKHQPLQLLIDVKTEAVATLNKLIEVLKKYPKLTHARNLKFVITGNRPLPDSFVRYPYFIWFDGILSDRYTDAALQKIVMMSDNLKKYTIWNGKGGLSATDKEKLQVAIAKSHTLHKPVRFWNAPDNPDAWEEFIRLQADFINTDHIIELAKFLNLRKQVFSGNHQRKPVGS